MREGVGEFLGAEDERADVRFLGSSDHPVEFGDRPRLPQARSGEIRMAWSVSFGDGVPVTAGHWLTQEGAKILITPPGLPGGRAGKDDAWGASVPRNEIGEYEPNRLSR